MLSACGMQGDLYLPNDEAEGNANKMNTIYMIQNT